MDRGTKKVENHCGLHNNSKITTARRFYLLMFNSL